MVKESSMCSQQVSIINNVVANAGQNFFQIIEEKTEIAAIRVIEEFKREKEKRNRRKIQKYAFRRREYL